MSTMKHLFFSLIVFSFLLITPVSAEFVSDPNIIADFLNSKSNDEKVELTKEEREKLIEAFENFNQPNNPYLQGFSAEEREYYEKKETETLDQWFRRVETQNAIRKSEGLKEFPTTISTTQIPDEPTNQNLSQNFDLSKVLEGSGDKKTTKQNDAMNLSDNPNMALSDSDILNQIAGNQGTGLSGVLNQLFYAGLIIAVVLAIFMIIRGGLEYMTSDIVSSKSTAKNRIKAAIGGLILCFSTILILNTINPGLTNLKLEFPELRNLEVVEFEGVRLQNMAVVDLTRDGTPMTGTVSGKISDEALEITIRELINKHGLTDLNPADAAAFFPSGKGTEDEWVALIASMIKHESDFNPSTTYQESFTNSAGQRVQSTGLLQLSQESVRGYAGFNSSLRGITTDQLMDPYTNLDAGVTILKRLVSRDGYISGPSNKGGAAYWSVLRPSGKLNEVKNYMKDN